MPCAPAADHHVRMYDGEEDLARSVARFVGEGLERGESALVIATPKRRDPFRRALFDLGVDPSHDRLAFLDARLVLEAICLEGEPNQRRFDAVIGPLVDPPGRRLRIYGEMVDLLWNAGRFEAAVRLEALWNDFLRRKPLRLLCGYGMDLFDRALDPSAFSRACGAHELTLHPRNRERLEVAVRDAFDAVFGRSRAEDLRGLVAATRRSEPGLGTAERSILWVRRHLPARAADLLSEARRLCEESGAPRALHRSPQISQGPLKLLCTDGEAGDTLFLRHALGKLGARVLLNVVEDGDRTVEYLAGAGPYADRRRYPLPDLLLLQLRLAGGDGIEVLSWLRSQTAFVCLPVLILTALEDPVATAGAYDVGADLCLGRPQDLASFVALVRGILTYAAELRAP